MPFVALGVPAKSLQSCLILCDPMEYWASLIAQLVKSPPVMQEIPVPGSGRSAGEGIGYPLHYSWASLVAQLVKESARNVGRSGFDPWVGRSPGEGNWLPTPVFWPGEFNSSTV